MQHKQIRPSDPDRNNSQPPKYAPAGGAWMNGPPPTGDALSGMVEPLRQALPDVGSVPAATTTVAAANPEE